MQITAKLQKIISKCDDALDVGDLSKEGRGRRCCSTNLGTRKLDLSFKTTFDDPEPEHSFKDAFLSQAIFKRQTPNA
jgi:hypothetical protein